MRRLTLLPAAVIVAVLAVFVLNAAARSSGNESATNVRASSSAPELTLAATVADGIAVDDVEAPAAAECRAINLFDKVGVAGSFVWNGDSQMSELIEELVSSGDLSVAGADRLREALKHHNVFTIGEAGTGPFAVEGHLGLGQLFFSPDGEEGTHRRLRVLGQPDGKQLKILIDDDGSVVVEGEGYTAEELEEIREQVEQDRKDGKPISILGIPGAPHAFSWSGEADANVFAIPAPGFGGKWTDENGEFNFKQFSESFPAPHSFSWESEDGTPAPHMFMFHRDDAELREQVERMVREILEEMGIDPDSRTKVNSTSA